MPTAQLADAALVSDVMNSFIMFSEVFLRVAHGSTAKFCESYVVLTLKNRYWYWNMSEEIKCNLDFVEDDVSCIFANMIKCEAVLTGMVNLSLRSDRKLPYICLM